MILFSIFIITFKEKYYWIRLYFSQANVREFANRLNVTTATLYNRIKEGVVQAPSKDGKLSYWLNSYVNSVVTQAPNSDKVAA
ncbi:hypothetical protein ACCE111639_03330 [Acinetobacter celticus]